MRSFLFILLQHLLPHHLLSRFVGFFASTEITWIKSFFIRRFMKAYNIDLSEAEIENPDQFKSFNEFFCRKLKADARPIVGESNIVTSPADGFISQLGPIESGRIIQAKGKHFSALELLGGDEEQAEHFKDGSFSTIYLSPSDYHRVHMPISGKLKSMVYVPGKLFSVNPTTTENVDSLFARNERVIAHFDTDIGPVAVVLVGAMIVASIDTVWAGQVAPPGKTVSTTHYDHAQVIDLNKGDEMGRFKLGSTVILLFPNKSLTWSDELREGSAIKMGEALATLN